MKKYLLLIIILPVFLLMFSCAAQLSSTNTKASGINMVVIPAGWFMMGSDIGEFNEKPAHEVYLDTFEIDRYEVSANDFAEFLNEKENPNNNYFTYNDSSTIIDISNYKTGKGKEPGTSGYLPKKGHENYPANNVSWYGAYDYCRWKGKRLPTEAEWEKAAKGINSGIFPWGNSFPDSAKARYNQKWQDQNTQVMVPVDSMSDGGSPYGVLNMSGNVMEWVTDWYRQNYCDFCDPDGAEFTDIATEIANRGKSPAGISDKHPYIPPKNNPGGPAAGSFKVLRGGSWQEESEMKIRTSFRYWLVPMDRQSNTGFRCAK